MSARRLRSTRPAPGQGRTRAALTAAAAVITAGAVAIPAAGALSAGAATASGDVPRTTSTTTKFPGQCGGGGQVQPLCTRTPVTSRPPTAAPGVITFENGTLGAWSTNTPAVKFKLSRAAAREGRFGLLVRGLDSGTRGSSELSLQVPDSAFVGSGPDRFVVVHVRVPKPIKTSPTRRVTCGPKPQGPLTIEVKAGDTKWYTTVTPSTTWREVRLPVPSATGGVTLSFRRTGAARLGAPLHLDDIVLERPAAPTPTATSTWTGTPTVTGTPTMTTSTKASIVVEPHCTITTKR